MTSDDMQRLTLTATQQAEGERLDRFLAGGIEAPTPLSRTRIKALILDGAVTENGRPVTDPSQSVRLDAEYALLFPPVREAVPQAEDIPLDILFEDSHIIILNKPSGMVVHPGPGQPDGTLVNALISHCGDSLTGIGGVMRPGIVHRLDKDTSGVLLLARDRVAARHLTRAFQQQDMEKTYLALVAGAPPETLEMKGALLKRGGPGGEMMAVDPEGQPSHSSLRLIEPAGVRMALVALQPRTGRTHQLRVHMAHAGHPIVGDGKYGGAASHVGGGIAARLHLHAWRLRLADGTLIEAPLPAHFRDTLATLGLAVPGADWQFAARG